MGRLEALTCPVQQHPGPIPGLGQFLRRTLDLCSRTRSVWRAPAPMSPRPARAVSPARRSINTARRAPAPLPPLISEHPHQLYFPNTAQLQTCTAHTRGEPRAPLGARQFLRLLGDSGLFSSKPGPSGCSGGSPFSPLWIADFPALPAARTGSAPPRRCRFHRKVRFVVGMAMAAAPWLCRGRSQSIPVSPWPCYRTGAMPTPSAWARVVLSGRMQTARRWGRDKTRRVSLLPPQATLPVRFNC